MKTTRVIAGCGFGVDGINAMHFSKSRAATMVVVCVDRRTKTLDAAIRESCYRIWNAAPELHEGRSLSLKILRQHRQVKNMPGKMIVPVAVPI